MSARVRNGEEGDEMREMEIGEYVCVCVGEPNHTTFYYLFFLILIIIILLRCGAVNTGKCKNMWPEPELISKLQYLSKTSRN